MHKFAKLVDLENCCKMRIWLKTSALIQPRTSLSKFGGDLLILINRILDGDAGICGDTPRFAACRAFHGSEAKRSRKGSKSERKRERDVNH